MFTLLANKLLSPLVATYTSAEILGIRDRSQRAQEGDDR